MNPLGWHSRGYLPHFNGGEIAQTVTFRLHGSLPQELVARTRQELRRLPPDEAAAELRQRLEEYLDHGHEPTWLSRPEVAGLVQDAMLHFDGQRYRLLAWAIMSNHVHAMLMPMAPRDLSDILFSWRSYTANQANKLLERRGAFWDRDYFDRFVRNEQHPANAMAYIEMNPVRAGLCASPELWRFGSASLRLHGR